jgi:hypothetical protein
MASDRDLPNRLTDSDATKVIHVQHTTDCQCKVARTWMQAHVERTGVTPQRCNFYHRSKRDGRLVRCQNPISTPGWRGCHVWMEGKVVIVPGCSTCNGSRSELTGMYVADVAKDAYVEVVEGRTCKCPSGQHAESFVPSPEDRRPRATTFESVAAA